MPDLGVPNFTFDELTLCKHGGRMQARARALAQEPATLAALTCLAILLQHIRDQLDAPIVVYPAFRYAVEVDGKWYGHDVSAQGRSQGSTTYRPKSQHTRGEAADCRVPGRDLDDVWTWIADECCHPFGQVINERRGGSHWLHVSIPGTSILDGRWIEGECTSYVHGRDPEYITERNAADVRSRWS